jgi:hypothetical protein
MQDQIVGCNWLGGVHKLLRLCSIQQEFLKEANVDCKSDLSGKEEGNLCLFPLSSINRGKLADTETMKTIRQSYLTFRKGLVEEFKDMNVPREEYHNHGKRKFTVDCPECGMSIIVEEWYYPATREEPPDAGADISKQECSCPKKMDSEKWYDMVMNAEQYEKKKRQKEIDDHWVYICESNSIPR